MTGVHASGVWERRSRTQIVEDGALMLTGARPSSSSSGSGSDSGSDDDDDVAAPAPAED